MLCFPKWLPPSSFPNKLYFAFHILHTCYMSCPFHPPWFYHSNIFGEEYKLRSSSLCTFFHLPVSLSLLDTYTPSPWWDFRFSRQRVWRWLSSGILHHVVLQKLTNISEVLTASIIKVMCGSTHLWNVCQFLWDYMHNIPEYSHLHPPAHVLLSDWETKFDTHSKQQVHL
jgi:hypothetical protein